MHVSIVIVIILTFRQGRDLKRINNVDIDLGLEMALTSSVYRAASQKTLKLHGVDDITREQFGILLLLSLTDGLYQTQIANILGKDRPNITRMIDILETNKFIRREKDENNRRILKVYITEKGQEKVKIAKPLKDRMNATQYKGMTDEEIITLVTLLRKVRKNIEEEYKINE